MRRYGRNDFDESGGFVESSIEGRHLTLPDAFKIGIAISYLKEAGKNGYNIGQEDEDLILGALDTVQTILQSRNIDSRVLKKVTNYKKKIKEDYEATDSLSEEDAEMLEWETLSWINLLHQDFENEQRIPAADTGVMNVEKLLNSPESLFSRPIWNWMDNRPKSDIKEACRSIVVSSPTASVMLSLRAVEHCLRVWHEEKTGEALEAGWGRVLGRLINEFIEDDSSNKPFQQQLGELPPVLSNLHYLKEKRNEVNHPQKSPTEPEARRTLMFVVGTITEIHNELVEVIEATYKGITISAKRDEFDPVELVMKITRELNKPGEGAYYADVCEFAQNFGLDGDDVENVKEELLMTGRVYEPESSVLKPI